jgi:hypothetical protein
MHAKCVDLQRLSTVVNLSFPHIYTLTAVEVCRVKIAI